MKTTTYSLLIILVAILFTYSSCETNNAEELYPNAGNCDTTSVKFSTEVKPILMANCAKIGCHSTSFMAAGFAYETHTETMTSVSNGKLIGAINHKSGFSKMPKGGSKLIACDINKIQAWINRGALDN